MVAVIQHRYKTGSISCRSDRRLSKYGKPGVHTTRATDHNNDVNDLAQRHVGQQGGAWHTNRSIQGEVSGSCVINDGDGLVSGRIVVVGCGGRDFCK
eukprot:scaffold34550_cov54-Cyclotella_meneghiniana.AAC.3